MRSVVQFIKALLWAADRWALQGRGSIGKSCASMLHVKRRHACGAPCRRQQLTGQLGMGQVLGLLAGRNASHRAANYGEAQLEVLLPPRATGRSPIHHLGQEARDAPNALDFQEYLYNPALALTS